MNIFELYQKKIIALISKNSRLLKLNKFNDFKGVTVEIPPLDFNYDLSCNICLILGKTNKVDPKQLALKFKELLKNDIKDFNEIVVAGPGFLNIRLSNESLINNINEIIISLTISFIISKEDLSITV